MPDENSDPEVTMQISMTAGQYSEWQRAQQPAAAAPAQPAQPAQQAPAPKASAGTRLDRLESAIERLAGVLTPTPAAADPNALPMVSYQQAVGPRPDHGAPPWQGMGQPKSAAAPSAPVKNDMLTNSGLVDIFNLQPHQLDQLGPQGLRVEFEKILDVGQRLSGAPPRPKLPSRK